MSKQQHKLLRHKFNKNCLKRDNYRCVICDDTENLEVHHITNRHVMPNGGYSMYNGITLCSQHHWEVEAFLNGKSFNSFLSPENLYKLIDSSYELALKQSEKL